MKKIKSLKSIGISLIAIAVLFFSSCSSTPDSIKPIPKETNIVSVVDFYSLAKKGKLDKITEKKFYKTLKKEIRNENKKIAKILDEVVENPSMTGIDFSTDVFLYYINAAKDEQFTCMSAAIDDEEDFSVFIDDVLDKSGVDFDIEEEKEYKYTTVMDKMGIAWNNDVVIFLVADNHKSGKNLDLEIETLLELKDEDQISENDEFADFYKNKKDISIWYSTNMLEDSYWLKKYDKQVDFEITNNYISSYLNFEDEEISLKTHFTPNEELKAILDENDVWDNKFNSDLLKLFPKKSYAAASISLNPTQLYEIYKKQNEENIEKVEEGFKKQMDVDFKKVIESIGGSMVLSLYNFEKKEFTYMSYGYGFDINKARKMEKPYGIDKAGDLTDEQIEQLNAGKTITTKKYNNQVFFNIKNILDEGGNVQSAINSGKPINYYSGGYSYGKFVEKTKEATLPILGLSFDIKGNEVIKKLLKKVPEEVLTKNGDYYEFKFDGKYPAYFAFNEESCLITNGEKTIKAFKNGGYDDDLGDSDIEDGISSSSFFAYMNLDYDEYPKDLQKMSNEMSSDKQKKLIKEWSKFAKSIELKQNDKNSFEMIFKLKDADDNSLNTLITTIDESYEDFL